MQALAELSPFPPWVNPKGRGAARAWIPEGGKGLSQGMNTGGGKGLSLARA